jgi:hypothetical protein
MLLGAGKCFEREEDFRGGKVGFQECSLEVRKKFEAERRRRIRVEIGTGVGLARSDYCSALSSLVLE